MISITGASRDLVISTQSVVLAWAHCRSRASQQVPQTQPARMSSACLPHLLQIPSEIEALSAGGRARIAAYSIRPRAIKADDTLETLSDESPSFGLTWSWDSSLKRVCALPA